MPPKAQQHPQKKKKNHHNGGKRHHNGGGSGGNASVSPAIASLKSVSHALSWVLRHAAPELGLSMTSDGYCPVREILAHDHHKLKRITSLDSQIRPVVETNDKQRFRLELRPAALYKRRHHNKEWSVIELTAEQAAPVAGVPEAALETETAEAATHHSNDNDKDEQRTTPTNDPDLIWCIRANQGHSLPGINPDLLLQEISRDELASLPVIVHGTYMDAWRQIQASGALSRMNRTHIHCASGFVSKQGSGVISGMRASCQVHVYVSGRKCAADGIRFFRSDNGVLLTAGVQDRGLLPLKYLSHVTDSKGKVLLDQRDKDGDEKQSAETAAAEDTS